MRPVPTIRAASRALLVSSGLALSAGALAAQVPGVTGTLVVTNKRPSTLTLVDVASGRTLATLPTGTGPHEVVLSRDGRTAVHVEWQPPDVTHVERQTLDAVHDGMLQGWTGTFDQLAAYLAGDGG